MTPRTPYDSPAARPSADTGGAARDRRRGPHLGPIRITPLRATLFVALLGGLGFLAWSTLDRDQLQVPLMATGFAICGIVFAATAILSVFGVVRAGREGRDARAVLTAFLGGLVAVGALMFLSAAVIMSLIWSGTKST